MYPPQLTIFYYKQIDDGTPEGQVWTHVLSNSLRDRSAPAALWGETDAVQVQDAEGANSGSQCHINAYSCARCTSYSLSIALLH